MPVNLHIDYCSLSYLNLGVSLWNGYRNLNDISIGIEIVNVDEFEFNYTKAQLNSVINLVKDIRSRWNIPDHFVVA